MGYYGRLEGNKPIRMLADDILAEDKENMQRELREMEEKLFRHINESKREIIREFHGIKTKREELRLAKKMKKDEDSIVDTVKE